MLIEIVRINITEGSGGKTPYKLAEVVYKVNDQIKTNRVASFNRVPFQAISDAKPGDLFEVEFEKNAKGFWEMKSAVSAGKAAPGTTQTTSAAPAARSGNWETSEERAARQVMIVRQSSLSTAVALKPKATVAEVIETAKEFEAYVLGKEPVITGDVA